VPSWRTLRTTARRGLANIAFSDLTHLEHAIRRRLRVIQRQPGLINGCLTGTGLALNIKPP
jgi:putative transposase